MTADDIKELLREIKYPGFTRDIVSFGIIKDIALDPQRTEVRLVLTTRDDEVARQVVEEVENKLATVAGLPAVDVVVERPQGGAGAGAPGQAAAGLGRGPERVDGVAKLVAVASAKGGVGKSTVAANLAVALARQGNSVGLLDADIYGPSIPTMFGVATGDKPDSGSDGRLIPLERYGVRLVSMGFFVAEGAPLLWRGPMLTKALTQFIRDVEWGELDYLIIDLPPGTGDVQMTLTMQVALDAGIIVTTPQDVALRDVERGVRMFQQANVPVAGVIENMSFHVCPNCGRASDIFGKGGGEAVAERYGLRLLGRIPLERGLRESGDVGHPLAASAPDSEAARAFAQVAQGLELELPGREVGHA